MGAGLSKVVPIHIPVKEEWVPPRKAKRRWRKNFNLLSLLCCSTTRPVKTKESIPSTPCLYNNEPSSVQSHRHSNENVPFKTEVVQSTASTTKCHKTSVKELSKKARATSCRPSTVRVPTPRPRELRTPVPHQQEAKPTWHTPVIHSQNTGDSYDVTVGIPGNSPVNVSGQVIDSFFSPTEVMMDELLTCFMGQQDEYPDPPRGSLLLPLGDSFDSLDSYSWLSVLAGVNYDGFLEVNDDGDDDAILMPYDYGAPPVLSPTIPGTVNDIPLPKASYGTVTLPQREGWLSASPRARSPIQRQRSSTVAEAHNQHERIIIIDESKKKEPLKNRLLTAFRSFRRPSNRTQVTETSREFS